MSTFSPPLVYPSNVTPQPSSHSKGSFVPVFAVLAVIVVLSAVACILGRLCARRFSHSKQSGDHNPNTRGENKLPKSRGDHQKQHRGVHFEDGDLEYGFPKKLPKGKPAGYREQRGPKPAGYGENRGPKPAANGENKEETITFEYGESRASGK